MKYVKFTSFDNTILQAYVWDDVKMPKGVVQIVHGMAEHARRYDDFAKFLNANGYIVFADDHRAHGNTEKKNDIGYHAGDIYGDSVKDELFITKYLSEKYALPVVFLGHSYGSFIGQRYLENDSAAVGVILSGSARQPGVVVGAGKLFSNAITKMKGEQAKGKFMDKVAFGSFNKPFKKEGHNFAWLSRDVDQVKKYCYDEQCGYVMSNNFYKCFMNGLSKVYKKENLAKVNKDRPIAIFSGENDPVGGKNASNVKKLAEMYKGLGVKNVSIKIYKDCRHEILNELNNKEVYKDMLDAINGFVGK